MTDASTYDWPDLLERQTTPEMAEYVVLDSGTAIYWAPTYALAMAVVARRQATYKPEFENLVSVRRLAWVAS